MLNGDFIILNSDQFIEINCAYFVRVDKHNKILFVNNENDALS